MSFFKSVRPNAAANETSRSSNSPLIPVQAKLKVGEANDKYEKEADSIADKVVNNAGLFGQEPFFAPPPKLQRSVDTDQEVQKSEEAEQIQEKPIRESITPLVQRQETEEPVQMMESEEPVQMMAEEEPVQAKQDEESVQKKGEEEPVQMKQDEEPVQMMQEEEPVQMMEDDSEVQKQDSESENADVQRQEIGTTPPVEASNIQRKDDEIQEKEEEIQEKESEDAVQRNSNFDSGDTSNLESNLASSKGGGSSMDSSTKDKMEAGFGTDFSGVKIHNDANAVQMNKELGSHAFANGNDIYFNEGKYNPSSKDGQHLLAHELTHTVQQGASTQPAVQKAAEAAEPAEAPALKPTTPLDITHKLNLTDAWAKYLDAQYAEGKRTFEVDVKIGEKYSGTIKLNKKKGTAEGETAKYELSEGNQRYLTISGWDFLNPLREAGVTPILVLKSFGDDQITTGFLSVKLGETALVADVQGFIRGLNENLEKMQFLGIEPLNVDGLENTFEQGRLVFQVSALKTVVDGYLEAGGGMGIMGDAFTFNLNANIDVAGLASGEFTLARGDDGKLSGTADIEADIANVNAKIHVEYINGAVTIQGTGKIQSEKFSGEITLLVTDKARSKEMMNAALGVESMDAEKQQAEAPAGEPVAKSKNNQVLAGWGEVTANITPWLTGTAKVGIDNAGHVTIVGEITVDDEIELMEQRGKKVDLFNVEIKAGYGIPLVGQVFLFASIGMFMNAGFGPLVLKGVGFKGTYSTDPDILQEFEISGTLGINAFAIIGLEAEAGVGVTILGHDLKAGVNVTAATGLRAYAEATPTLEYKEQASPEGGKIGETRLKGHFEAAAQLFMQLSGSLFYELDSPWWSPAPDGREDFPLGEVQYPIGDSMGIGADMDWLVGSPDIPELKFSPVEFDPDKFTADVMADPPPRKSGKSDAEEKGEWVDGNKPGDQQDNPELKDGDGLPDTGKKKEDLKKLPDEQKYMRALDEMSKLEKADPKPTFAVAKAKAAKVKAKYGLDTITVTDKDELAEVYVKHAKENNKKHLLEVPLMSAAERFKLLKTAMDDLTARNKKAGGEAGTVTEDEAKELIATWQKAHPVVEEARVVDGGATWDYFIDIGDKQNTESGKLKSAAPKDGAADQIKDNNKGVENVEITAEDKVKHKKIADEIEGALKEKSKAVKFEDLHAEKKKQAKSLEDRYQPKLKKGINLDITLKDVASDKKDDDLDISIRIAPNTHERTIEVTLSGDGDATNFTLTETLDGLDSGKKYQISYIVENGERKEFDIDPGDVGIRGLLMRLNDQKGYNKKQISRALKLLDRIELIEPDGDADNPKGDVEKRLGISKDINTLAATLVRVLKVGDHKIPETADWEFGSNDGRPKFAFVKYLSHKNVSGGSEPSSTNGTKGYDLIVMAGKTNTWVQMHLILGKVGGPGDPKNLIPGPKSTNSGIFDVHEKVLRVLLGKDGPEKEKKTAEKMDKNEAFLTGAFKTKNVMWVSAEVTSFWPAKTHPGKAGFDYDASSFAQQIEVRSGLHYPNESGAWEMDKDAIIKSSIPVIEPNFGDSTVEVPNIHNMTKVQMQVVLGIGGTSTNELDTIVKANSFDDFADLDLHIRSAFASEPRKLTRWIADLAKIASAESAGKVVIE